MKHIRKVRLEISYDESKLSKQKLIDVIRNDAFIEKVIELEG